MTSDTSEMKRGFSIQFPAYLIVKHTFEWLLAASLLLLLLPVMAIAAILVKLDSRGPVFYVQTRVGRGGRHFRLIKLRSMRPDAEANSGAVWCQSNDPRITRIGAILRATHIDEFPQLWNVLRGEMSLIGPRPERPEFVRELALQIDGYEERLLVRPGITGLAQLCLPPDSDLESVRRKIRLDLYYARYVNPWLDIRIAIGTATHFLTVFVSLLPVWLRMPDLRDATNDAAVCSAVNRSTAEIPFETSPVPRPADQEAKTPAEQSSHEGEVVPLLASSSWEHEKEHLPSYGRSTSAVSRLAHAETAVEG